MESKQPIGVGIVVLNRQKTHILWGKRKNSYKSGTFGMPGGRVEIGESLIKCCQRELLEETGIKSSNFLFLGIVRDFQKEYDFIHLIFLCVEYQGTPKLLEPEKCEDWFWFPINKSPQPILPGHKSALKLYIKYLETNSDYFIDLHK